MRLAILTLALALPILGCGGGSAFNPPVVVGKGHDNDGDELGATLETEGWEILIDDKGFGPFNNGATLTTRFVTSDPNVDDTDGDGVLDGEEFMLRTDPRSDDTDGDGLTDYEEWKQWLTSPVSVDTDGDARGPDPENPLPPNPDLFDGAELHFDANGNLLGSSTSPTLADTDGDGATDYEEVGHAFRSLVMAEIPDVRILLDGPIDVFLNVEYAESRGQETAYGTSVTTTRSDTTSKGSSNTLEENLRLSATVTAGVEGEVGTMGASTTVSAEVSGTVEQSWMSGSTQTTTQESTTALQQESSKLETDRRENTEIAASGTLTAGITIENTSPSSTVRLESLGIAIRHWQSDGRGGKTFRTLGTLRPDIPGFTLPPGSRTPVLRVAAEDVAPDVVRRFLAEPGSLHLSPAYFDLVDEQGIDFAFLAENAFSQTAVVEINFGDGEAQTYRVATNVNRTPQGELAGITMREVMDSVIGLSWSEAPSTTSICGGNPMVLTEVEGRVGSAGFVQGVDDPKSFRIWRSAMNRPGFLNCDNWSDIVLMPGDVITLTYAQDADGDGLTDAAEESFGTKDTDDCDGDGLKDGAEAALGWWAGAPGVSATETPAPDRVYLAQFGYPRLVYSNPRIADTDGDGLNDADEKWKGCDPTAPDTDGDGLLDGEDPFPLLRGVLLYVDGNVSGGDGSSWGQAYGTMFSALAQARRDNLAAVTLIRSTSGTTLLEKVDSVRAPDGTHWPENLIQGRKIVTEIWVADGQYNGTVGLDDPLNGVGIYGGFTGAAPDGVEETTRGARTKDPLGNNTILTAPAGDPVVLVAASADRSIILDGFVVTGARRPNDDGGGITCSGSATLRNLLVTDNEGRGGGGMFISSGSPLIETCQFTQNRSERTAGDPGGAIRIVHGFSGPGPVIRDCEFVANTGKARGGAIYAEEVTGLVIEGCVIAANTCIPGLRQEVLGAGVSLVNSSVSVRNCRIEENDTDPANPFFGPSRSYAIVNTGAVADTSLINQTNDENSGPTEDHRCGGGIHVEGGSLEVAQCVFRGNIASQGAGIRARGVGVQVSVVQSTFADNLVTAQAACISTRTSGGSVLVLQNCIFGPGSRLEQPLLALMTPTQLAAVGRAFDVPFLGGDRVTSVRQSAVTLNSMQSCLFTDPAVRASGTGLDERLVSMTTFGNRIGDPAFVGPYDLRLTAGSPAVDAGNGLADFAPLSSGFQLLPSLDLRGETRVRDGDGDGDARVDMGAYELR